MDTANFRDLAVEEFDTRTLLAHAGKQAAARRYEDFFICDIDGHHWEVFNWPQISDYIEDPRAAPAGLKYQGYGGGGITAPTGLYQGDGRAHHPHGRAAPEQIPPGQQRGPHPDAALDGFDGDRLRPALFPTPMLGLPFTPKPEVEVAMARLQPLARRACAGRGARNQILALSADERSRGRLQDGAGFRRQAWA